ncbi:MAG: pitrilysin family protein [Acidobacteriota bacterium]|nr:insulinase family protein [Blastocatellia bacterium]MDW8239086.1 pitrilysin family protein [Acidobacteriota bacterium]
MMKNLVVGLILIASVVSPSLHAAGQDSSQTSQSQKSPPVPPVYFDSLLNGLQILIVERPGPSDAVIGFTIKKGSAFDLVGKEGSADLLARLVLRGSQTVNDRPLSQLFQELDTKADVLVTLDMTRFTFQTPVKNLPYVFPILAEILTRSVFPETDVTQVKQQRLAELRQANQSLLAQAQAECMKLIFARHPYARPVEGTAATYETITPADLSRHHRRFYLSNDSILTVVGNVSAQAVMQLIRPTFGAMRKGKVVPSTFVAPTPPTGIQIKLFDRPQMREAAICVGYLTRGRDADSYLPLVLLNQALVQLLQQSANAFAPEQVTITNSLNIHRLAGAVTITANAPARLGPTVLTNLFKMLERAREISAPELSATKSSLATHVAAQVQTHRQLADQLQDIELYGLARDYIVAFQQRLDQITLQQVKNVASDILSTTNAHVVVIGPAAELAEPLKSVGTVELVK